MNTDQLQKQLKTIGSVLTTVEERTRLALKVGVSFATVNRHLDGKSFYTPTAREIVRQVMGIDKLIEQWQEKHYILLNEYSKGNANNEVMQMYRSQMKNILDFIEQLRLLKNTYTNQ